MADIFSDNFDAYADGVLQTVAPKYWKTVSEPGLPGSHVRVASQEAKATVLPGRNIVKYVGGVSDSNPGIEDWVIADGTSNYRVEIRLKSSDPEVPAWNSTPIANLRMQLANDGLTYPEYVMVNVNDIGDENPLVVSLVMVYCHVTDPVSPRHTFSLGTVFVTRENPVSIGIETKDSSLILLWNGVAILTAAFPLIAPDTGDDISRIKGAKGAAFSIRNPALAPPAVAPYDYNRVESFSLSSAGVAAYRPRITSISYAVDTYSIPVRSTLFSPISEGSIHVESDWRIAKDFDITDIHFESLGDRKSLNLLEVHRLRFGVRYYWVQRMRDQYGQTTAWSAPLEIYYTDASECVLRTEKRPAAGVGVFPSAELPPVSVPFVEGYAFSTVVSDVDDAVESRRSRWTESEVLDPDEPGGYKEKPRARRLLIHTYDKTIFAKINALFNFYQRCKGPHHKFSITHPLTGETIVARFQDNSLSKTLLIWKLFRCEVVIIEVI